MGRAPCCDTGSVKKGAWSAEEDRKLKEYIHNYGTGGNWIALPAKAGLKRCGKSCRLRWLNYLRPNIKHGDFSDEEDRVICTLFATIGSRWSIIAAQLPGRTDNHVKNYWNTKLKKKLHHLLIAATHGHHRHSSKPPAPPCFSREHHHHTSPTSAASSGQLLVFGAGGSHEQHSPCAVDNGAGLHFGISNNSSITNNSSCAVDLESLMLSGLQLQQEDTDNLLIPAAAATAENDIMTSGGVLLLDHHQQRQYQQYGGGGGVLLMDHHQQRQYQQYGSGGGVLLLDHHQQRQYQQYGGGGSYERHAMKPPLMISPDGFFYGDGEAAAAGAAATQQGTRFLY